MRISIFFLALLGWPLLSHAAALTDEQIKAAISPLVDLEYAQGIVVGVVDSSGQRVLGFGRSDEVTAGLPDGKTIFEIGSVTKVFTSLLLADLSQRGLVQVNDPVGKYLPASVHLPVKDRPITLLDLSTHRSGLPRLPSNFVWDQPADPYALYTPKVLYDFLNSWQPPVAPGQRVEYSNLGVGLLGHVLAVRAGMGFNQLLKERIFQPSGMDNSTLNHDPKTPMRVAKGHDADGNIVALWSMPDPFSGAGGICSTAEDMLRFVTLQINPPDGTLGDAIRQSHLKQNQFDANNDIGLGWLISKRGYLWHNGETGGFHSFVAFDPLQRVGIVILSNSAGGVVDYAGVQLMGLAIDAPMPAFPVLRKTVNLDQAALDRFTGDYVLGLTFLHIRRDGARLFGQISGQPEYRIYPESSTRCFWKAADAQADFEFDGADPSRAKRLMFHQNGRDTVAPRLATTQPAN